MTEQCGIDGRGLVRLSEAADHGGYVVFWDDNRVLQVPSAPGAGGRDVIKFNRITEEIKTNEEIH